MTKATVLKTIFLNECRNMCQTLNQKTILRFFDLFIAFFSPLPSTIKVIDLILFQLEIQGTSRPSF